MLKVILFALLLILELQTALLTDMESLLRCQQPSNGGPAFFPNIPSTYFNTSADLNLTSPGVVYIVSTVDSSMTESCRGRVKAIRFCYHIQDGSNFYLDPLMRFLLLNRTNLLFSVLKKFTIYSNKQPEWCSYRSSPRGRVCCENVSLTNVNQFHITSSAAAYGIEVVNDNARLLLLQSFHTEQNMQHFQIGALPHNTSTFHIKINQLLPSKYLLLRFLIDIDSENSSDSESRSSSSTFLYSIIGVLCFVFLLGYACFVAYCLRKKYRVRSTSKEEDSEEMQSRRKRKVGTKKSTQGHHTAIKSTEQRMALQIPSASDLFSVSDGNGASNAPAATTANTANPAYNHHSRGTEVVTGTPFSCTGYDDYEVIQNAGTEQSNIELTKNASYLKNKLAERDSLTDINYDTPVRSTPMLTLPAYSHSSSSTLV